MGGNIHVGWFKRPRLKHKCYKRGQALSINYTIYPYTIEL